MKVSEASTSKDNASEIWAKVQEKLKLEYGEATFRSWLSKLSYLSAQNGHLTLSAPTKFLREWIIANYKETIRKFWNNYDPTILNVDILIKSTTTTTKTPAESTLSNSLPQTPRPYLNPEAENTNAHLINQLDTRFTFENFVVGNPNELAYAAARSVAESSKVQTESNPLFLYGGVGLGKTHLMHAIALHIYNNDQDRKVIYMSAERFMYQFVNALRNNDILSFKEYFRSVDVLMIDDVQFICGKDSTQEEFFHTFNALIDNNCQVVISCDRSPSDLEEMEERIRSRLGWGLVVDVHRTTYELRLGILQSKIDQMNIFVPQNVVEFLASKVQSNVRELEGALNKVVAHSKLVGKEITLENTKEILKDLIRSNEKVVTIEEIQKKIAEYYNIRLNDMISSRRQRSIVRPRQIAMYLAKSITTKSLSEIGKKFGGKDHTTVMHAVRTIEGLLDTTNEITEDIKLLTRQLEN